jgi:hypothetical protein
VEIDDWNSTMEEGETTYRQYIERKYQQQKFGSDIDLLHVYNPRIASVHPATIH